MTTSSSRTPRTASWSPRRRAAPATLLAGGPVVEATLPVMILTPVAPHFTIDRSIVVADDKVIRLVAQDKPAIIVADGQDIGSLDAGQFVEVRKSPSPVRVVATRSFDLASRLHEGLREVMPKSQLLELYAHGLGVIQEARLEFGSGFNVLTVRPVRARPCSWAPSISVWEATVRQRARRSPPTCAPRRSLTATVSAKSSSPGNRRLGSTAQRRRWRLQQRGTLRALAHELIVIHGQHDSLTLRSRGEVLRLIDAKGNVSVDALSRAKRDLYEAQRERSSLGGDTEERTRELDFVQFQIDELEGASIRSAGNSMRP